MPFVLLIQNSSVFFFFSKIVWPKMMCFFIKHIHFFPQMFTRRWWPRGAIRLQFDLLQSVFCLLGRKTQRAFTGAGTKGQACSRRGPIFLLSSALFFSESTLTLNCDPKSTGTHKTRGITHAHSLAGSLVFHSSQLYLLPALEHSRERHLCCSCCFRFWSKKR